MNGCVYRTADNQCEKFSDPVRNTLSWCVGDEPCEARKPSNADHIRSMSDEELANCLLCKRSVPHCPPIDMTKYAPCDDVEDCTACWLAWLKKEVEDG